MEINMIKLSTRYHAFMLSIVILFFLALIIQPKKTYAASDTSIGIITKINGSAYARTESSNEKRILNIGSNVYEKDIVVTEEKSSVILIFNDKTRFELGPKSELEATQYAYKGNASEDSMSIKVLKGAFRFVSGLVAKHKNESMKVRTPVVTIGIRGTQVVGEATATSSTVILIESEDKSESSAIDVYNDFGSVTIDEPGYGTDVPDQYSPPSPPRRMRLQTINNLMRSMQNANRVNIPRPRMP